MYIRTDSVPSLYTVSIVLMCGYQYCVTSCSHAVMCRSNVVRSSVMCVFTYVCMCVCVLQAIMEKLSLEVEKTLKLNSQLEETGDSKKV